MKKTNNKVKNKGITLIALIITIIILLILAGVAISTLTGDDGLFKKAKDAAEKTEQADREERAKLDQLEELIDETSSGEKTVEQVIDEHPGELEEDSDGKVINSIEDLVYFADSVTKGNTYSEQTVKLGLSLDFNSSKSYVDPYRKDYGTYGYNEELKTVLTSGEGFKSIGITTEDDISKIFAGTFDGKGNTIYNLYFNVNNKNSNFEKRGLFSQNNGTIQNLNLVNVNLYLSANDGRVSGICGQNSKSGTIENCTVSGNIKNESKIGSAGGVTCYCSGSIENCGNFAKVIGKFQGEITNSNVATVGGICGSTATTTQIKKCFNRGILEGEVEIGRLYMGGISSVNYGKTTNCYNNANFISNSLSNDCVLEIGGITGNIQSGQDCLIERCYSIGNISYNIVSEYIGMIAGFVNDVANITNSYYLKGENNLKAFGNKSEEEEIELNESYMRSSEFVKLLNKEQEEMWKQDSQNKNTGYPILKWQ